MRIKVRQQEPKFTPFKIEIEVQTKEEASALFAMALTNDSVPNVTHHHWGKHLPEKGVLKNILCQLRDVLISELNMSKY